MPYAQCEFTPAACMDYCNSASLALNPQLLLAARREAVRSTFPQFPYDVQTSQNGYTFAATGAVTDAGTGIT